MSVWDATRWRASRAQVRWDNACGKIASRARSLATARIIYVVCVCRPQSTRQLFAALRHHRFHCLCYHHYSLDCYYSNCYCCYLNYCSSYYYYLSYSSSCERDDDGDWDDAVRMLATTTRCRWLCWAQLLPLLLSESVGDDGGGGDWAPRPLLPRPHRDGDCDTLRDLIFFNQF